MTSWGYLKHIGGWIVFDALAILEIMLIAGCVSVGVTPDLPFPQAPTLTFAPYGAVCLDTFDAQSLRVYLDELAAYRQAIHRIHQAP